MKKSLDQKFSNKDAKKKILSLDGGGIRGILTLGMLKKIETEARVVEKNPNLLLGEYYDLIVGTSTGAIIASALAIGYSVEDLIQLYQTLGKEIFGKGRKYKLLKREWTFPRSIFNENYSSKIHEQYLKNKFENIELGDIEKIKCGLAINMKRADSYSLWTVTNHPKSKYYEGNKRYNLWELCRASSAAPYYFKPQILPIYSNNNPNQYGAFVDGGLSLANNPGWQSFLIAVVPSFGFNWQIGQENLNILSLGTGTGFKTEKPKKLEKQLTIEWASKLSDLFMIDALEMNEYIMNIVGKNLGKEPKIDRLSENLQAIMPKVQNNFLFSFSRHNVSLTSNGLSALGFSFTEKKIKSLCEMDHFENMDDLLQIGEEYAKQMTITNSD